MSSLFLYNNFIGIGEENCWPVSEYAFARTDLYSTCI